MFEEKDGKYYFIFDTQDCIYAYNSSVESIESKLDPQRFAKDLKASHYYKDRKTKYYSRRKGGTKASSTILDLTEYSELENIKKVSTKMKKVFMMVALVLSCTTGCLANETCAESVTTSEMSSLPAKKSTKKKKAITKKSNTTAKKTASKSSTSTATTASTATTDSSKTHSADTVNTKASAVGVLAELLGYAGGNSSNTTGSTTSKVGSIVGSILDNVIGSTTFKKADLCAHTWKYKSPGCAFTSENLLAKAGGEIAAKKVEEKLSTYYQKAGFSSSNTYFKFNEDGTFNAKIDGKSWSGTYTFDEKTHAIDLKGRLLLSLNGFATKNTSGISILFESKKLLTIIQTLTALSGNTTLGTIGEISKNYDGIRVGFDLGK